MRTVRIITTKGRSNFTIETNAQTWGELQKDLDANDVSYTGMKAIVGETNTTLDLKDAVLPKGLEINGTITDNCTIFLATMKMKAGSVTNSESMSYTELKAFVKANGGSAKFGNYTHFTTEQLRKAVKKVKVPVEASTSSCNQLCDVNEQALKTIIKTAQEALNSKSTKETEDLHAKLMNIQFELNN